MQVFLLDVIPFGITSYFISDKIDVSFGITWSKIHDNYKKFFSLWISYNKFNKGSKEIEHIE